MLDLPEGSYEGRTTAPGLFWTRWVWQGKVFTGNTVVNRIGPWQVVRGTVTASETEITIRYPGGLTDVLEPRPWGYKGRLVLGSMSVEFELRKR
jgi:hypothetical protein